MKDYRINDKWILDRVSSQSTSFSQWLNDILKTVEQSLEEIDPEQLKELKKTEEFTSVKDINKKLASAKREIAQMGDFGGLISRMGSRMSNTIMKSIAEELELSKEQVEWLKK